MKFLYDIFPLVLFFIAYKMYDIFVATMVAIVASVIQVSYFWFKHKRFETIHLVTLGAIVVFGGLTVILRDPVFIKWKTTIVNWIFATVILYSQFFTKRTVLEILLGSKVEMRPEGWRSTNLSWGLFFLFVGALNIYVAFYYGLDLDEARREEIWVNFKVFGVIGLTIIFVILQVFNMARYANLETPEKDK